MKHKPEDRLSRYLMDEQFIKWVQNPSAEDHAYWEAWLKQHPHLEHELEEAKSFARLMKFKPVYVSQMNVDQIKAGYKQQIAKPNSKTVKFSQARLRQWAAIILLLLTSVWGIYAVVQNQPNGLQQVSTSKGQKMSFILPDGSKVWLNGGSTLSYNNGFGKDGQRKLTLDGEAFFDVLRDPERPFLVQTSQLTVRVLGTSFNVCAYEEDEAIETYLVEGSVEIQHKSNSLPHKEKLLLKPDQQAVFQKQSTGIEVAKVDADKLAAWKTGTLIIEDEPFSEVAKKLERWYGAKVEVSEGAACRVSAKIENESLQEILELLKLTSKVAYEKQEDYVKLNVQCNQE